MDKREKISSTGGKRGSLETGRLRNYERESAAAEEAVQPGFASDRKP